MHAARGPGIQQTSAHAGFFANLKMIQEAATHLSYFRNIAESISSARRRSIPTRCARNSTGWPRTWPFINCLQIVLCGDKSEIRAEYMIDDNIYHLRGFEGDKIRFDSPRNRKVPDLVHRVHNWAEVQSFVRAQGVLPCIIL
jgi:5'(3')-deoxyribonucleotidase